MYFEQELKALRRRTRRKHMYKYQTESSLSFRSLFPKDSNSTPIERLQEKRIYSVLLFPRLNSLLITVRWPLQSIRSPHPLTLLIEKNSKSKTILIRCSPLVESLLAMLPFLCFCEWKLLSSSREISSTKLKCRVKQLYQILLTWPVQGLLFRLGTNDLLVPFCSIFKCNAHSIQLKQRLFNVKPSGRLETFAFYSIRISTDDLEKPTRRCLVIDSKRTFLLRSPDGTVFVLAPSNQQYQKKCLIEIDPKEAQGFPIEFFFVHRENAVFDLDSKAPSPPIRPPHSFRYYMNILLAQCHSEEIFSDKLGIEYFAKFLDQEN